MGRKIAVLTLSVLALGVAMVTPARADDAIFVVNMTGAAERPGPGDPDASGTARIFIDDDTNRICVYTTYANVDGTLSGYHIHEAPSTTSGPVRVPLAVPTGSPNFQCTTGSEVLLDSIAANPQNYYINLHSTPLYPGGAIRGQLA